MLYGTIIWLITHLDNKDTKKQCKTDGLLSKLYEEDDRNEVRNVKGLNEGKYCVSSVVVNEFKLLD